MLVTLVSNSIVKSVINVYVKKLISMAFCGIDFV